MKGKDKGRVAELIIVMPNPISASSPLFDSLLSNLTYLNKAYKPRNIKQTV